MAVAVPSPSNTDPHGGETKCRGHCGYTCILVIPYDESWRVSGWPVKGGQRRRQPDTYEVRPSQQVLSGDDHSGPPGSCARLQATPTIPTGANTAHIVTPSAAVSLDTRPSTPCR